MMGKARQRDGISLTFVNGAIHDTPGETAVSNDTHRRRITPAFVHGGVPVQRPARQHPLCRQGQGSATPGGPAHTGRGLPGLRETPGNAAETTELEALLLEDSLIKTHRPSYNRRQNKFTRQAYLEVSFDGTVHTVRVTDRPGTSRSYGPFSDIFYAQRLAAILDEHFGLSPVYGGGLRGKAPSADAAKRFLLGHDDGLIRSLREETERLASNLQFERAATVRDQLRFCERFLRRQSFVRLFTFGVLALSEVLSPRESEHYLFDRGRLVDHARCAIPEAWESGASRTDLGPSEPQWLLFERALVVYAWLSADSSRKSVRVLREDRS
jgi:hypothetical protein